MSDEDFMRLALAQALDAAALGEVPVGAVVVRRGEVIATGRNAPIDGHDPTAHAEIVALRAAALVVGNYRLEECELFVTLEPCAMCSGAMLNARLQRVVFGAAEPRSGAAGSVIDLFSQAQLNHQTQVRGGVLAEHCRTVMQAFFRQRRAVQREVSSKLHLLREDALRTPELAFDGLSGYPWQPNYISDLPALAGLRMHYLDEQGGGKKGGGTSLTYLCLHGNRAWSYEFRKLIPSLVQAGHRVIAPDLIGFGKSDKPKKDSFHTFRRQRQILLELVQRLDLQDIVLVVPARGGLLGLTLPMAAPERYQRLHIMNALPGGTDIPFSAVYQLWQQMRVQIPHVEKSLGTVHGDRHISAEEISASLVPFPDQGHRAALRAFMAMKIDGEADGTAISEAAERFWLDRWVGVYLKIPDL